MVGLRPNAARRARGRDERPRRRRCSRTGTRIAAMAGRKGGRWRSARPKRGRRVGEANHPGRRRQFVTVAPDPGRAVRPRGRTTCGRHQARHETPRRGIFDGFAAERTVWAVARPSVRDLKNSSSSPSCLVWPSWRPRAVRVRVDAERYERRCDAMRTRAPHNEPAKALRLRLRVSSWPSWRSRALRVRVDAERYERRCDAMRTRAPHNEPAKTLRLRLRVSSWPSWRPRVSTTPALRHVVTDRVELAPATPCAAPCTREAMYRTGSPLAADSATVQPHNRRSRRSLARRCDRWRRRSWRTRTRWRDRGWG